MIDTRRSGLISGAGGAGGKISVEPSMSASTKVLDPDNQATAKVINMNLSSLADQGT